MIKSEEAKERRKVRDREYKKKWRLDHLDILKARAHNWYLNNKEKRRAYRHEWYINNREKIISATQRYYKENRESILEYTREYSKKNRAKNRWIRMKNSHGFTEEDFNTMFKSQNNLCALCGTNNFGKQGPNIDHDHKTMKVRGILCNQCNVGLGSFKDDPLLLTKAINYLSKISLDK